MSNKQLAEKAMTPGPWHVEQNGAGSFAICNDGHCIAYSNSGSKSSHAVKHNFHADNERLANAMVMSAAPELLAVAHMIVSSEGIDAKIVDAAIAALAKAEGRAQLHA